MRLSTILFALTVVLIGCKKAPATTSERAQSSSADMRANAGGPREGMTVAPRTDYDAIAEEACRASGGECVARNDCGPDVGVRLPLVCRPGNTGLTCCRKPATDCPGYSTASCCRTTEGRLTNSGAYCDRGYPTCQGFSDEYQLSADRACKVALEEAAEDAPNRWEGSIGAREAGERACTQAGGTIVKTGEQCDGYLVPLGIEPCCLARALCPPQKPETDCCQRDGTVAAKECVSGAAVCPQGLLMIGAVREVPAGTCRGS